MSDKRFKMGESDIQGEMMFTDTQTNKIYWQEYFDEIIDLLNELSEENEQLKIANAKWFDKSLQDKQIRYSNANHKELTKKYLQLKEENEELRKELDNFKPVMFQDVRKGTVILYSKD